MLPFSKDGLNGHYVNKYMFLKRVLILLCLIDYKVRDIAVDASFKIVAEKNHFSLHLKNIFF